MTDDDLSPEQQEVRRLLADARHDQPMPASVVARLDQVLADLADEPVRVAPVTALATRRRRAATLLLAAAAVVAIGVGVGQVVGTGATDGDSLSASTGDDAGTAVEVPEAESAPGESAKGTDGTSSTNDSAQSEGGSGSEAFAEIGRSTLADDVTALREQSYSAGLVDGLEAAYDATGATCRSDAWGQGQFVPVRYDGIPAVLVFRRAMGDSQVADLFLCGDTEPRRSVTLPAP